MENKWVEIRLGKDSEITDMRILHRHQSGDEHFGFTTTRYSRVDEKHYFVDKYKSDYNGRVNDKSFLLSTPSIEGISTNNFLIMLRDTKHEFHNVVIHDIYGSNQYSGRSLKDGHDAIDQIIENNLQKQPDGIIVKAERPKKAISRMAYAELDME